jgi:release factor glutamine methyltransferase
LLGEWDFYSRTFHVDGRALIPRPETELLVEEILKRLPAGDPLALADVGTGSGVIGITLALERPAWSLSATDISPDAIALAEQNKARHACANLSLSCCDLLPESGGEYDAIVANLPYIPTSELPSLPAEVQRDPALALDGGHDGLAIIRRLLDAAPPRLHSNGWIFLEFGAGQSAALRAAFESASAFSNLEILPDLAGIPRFAIARRA